MARPGAVGLGVIFDLDGVLLDSEPIRFRVYRDLLAEYGAVLEPEVYAREFVGRGRGPEFAAAHFGLPLDAEALRARRAPLVRRALESEARPMPGALAALRRLHPRFALALATNSSAAEVAIALDRLGGRGRFDAVVGREDYARAKPAPDAFLEAARRLGLPAHRCLVVEDSERGLRAAGAAGMPCVALRHAFNRDADLSAARRTLEHLDALSSELVESILEAAA